MVMGNSNADSATRNEPESNNALSSVDAELQERLQYHYAEIEFLEEASAAVKLASQCLSVLLAVMKEMCHVSQYWIISLNITCSCELVPKFLVVDNEVSTFNLGGRRGSCVYRM